MRIQEVDGDFGIGVEPVYFEPAARDAAMIAADQICQAPGDGWRKTRLIIQASCTGWPSGPTT